MLVALAAGLLSSCLLLLVSARASAEWQERKTLSTRFALPRRPFGAPGWLVLSLFGVAVGIPAGLGFVRGNVALVLGALVATAVGRRLILSGAGSPPDAPDMDDIEPGPAPRRRALRWNRRYAWFVIVAWSILASGWILGSFDLRRMLAVQAALGPAALFRGPWQSVLIIPGFMAGVVSAVFWAATSPSIATVAGTKADVWLRWGETAFAVSAVSAAYFGPSAGALIQGPPATDLHSGVAGSFLLTCTAVATGSWARQKISPQRAGVVQLFCAGAVLLALGAGVFGL